MIGWLLTLLSRRRKKKPIIKHPLHLPRQVLGKILRQLSFHEIAVLRRVDRLCARICNRILNSEWNRVQEVIFRLTENPSQDYEAASLLSRAHNGRYYKAAQLVLVEVKMLNVYFMRHLKNSNGSFYPGYLLDLLSHFVKTIEKVTRQNHGDHGVKCPVNQLHILVNRISLVSEVVIQYHEKNLETNIHNRRRFFGAIILETIKSGFDGVQSSFPLFPPASSSNEDRLMDYLRILRLEIRRRSRNLVINSESENENNQENKRRETLVTPMIPILEKESNEKVFEIKIQSSNNPNNNEIDSNEEREKNLHEKKTNEIQEKETSVRKSCSKSKEINPYRSVPKKDVPRIWVRNAEQNTIPLIVNDKRSGEQNDIRYLRPRISKSTPKNLKLKNNSSELQDYYSKKDSNNRYFKSSKRNGNCKSLKKNKLSGKDSSVTHSTEASLKRIEGAISLAHLSHYSSSIEGDEDEEQFYKALNDHESVLTPSTELSDESLQLNVPPQWTNCIVDNRI